MEKRTQKPLIKVSAKQLKNPENINMKKKIGTTTYLVNAYFNQEASEDMVSRVRNLITR